VAVAIVASDDGWIALTNKARRGRYPQTAKRVEEVRFKRTFVRFTLSLNDRVSPSIIRAENLSLLPCPHSRLSSAYAVHGPTASQDAMAVVDRGWLCGPLIPLGVFLRIFEADRARLTLTYRLLCNCVNGLLIFLYTRRSCSRKWWGMRWGLE
jgi:hypothetical protein